MLVQAAGAASQDAHALYAEHQDWIRAWLRRRLGCSWTAADLTHDTFLRVIAGSELTTIREPRAYLTTVAHGLMVNHVRRREIERAILEALASWPEPQSPDLETRAIWIETLVELDRILDELPPRVRQAFLMAQLDGMRYAEIAERLGVSMGSVKLYLQKAVAHCMRCGA